MAYPKISKRKDGRFEAKVPIGKNPETNRSVRKTVYGKTKTEVKRKIDELQASVIKGEILPTMKTKYSLNEWCNEYLKLYTSQLSKGSFDRYKEYINKHIIPCLGNFELSKITPLNCQQFVNYLSQNTNLHVNTIRYVVGCLKRILEKACILGYLGKNPAENISIPKKRKPELTPFNDEQAINFIEKCKNTTLDNLCKFSIFTGLRLSEILALTWKDFKDNEMTISHQFARNKSDVTFYPTKNKRTRRVNLSNNALEILEAQKVIQAELQISKGKNYRNNLNLVFTDNNGNRLHVIKVRKRFKEICSEIGCSNVRFHDLRHTFAVLSIKAGVDIKTISESLGHHSVAFTLDQYAYVTNQMRDEAATKLDNYLNQCLN